MFSKPLDSHDCNFFCHLILIAKSQRLNPPMLPSSYACKEQGYTVPISGSAFDLPAHPATKLYNMMSIPDHVFRQSADYFAEAAET